MVVGVSPVGVVETGDIGEKTLLEQVKGLEVASVQLLFFQILEKALHDSVVIGVPLAEKDWIIPRSSMSIRKSLEVN